MRVALVNDLRIALEALRRIVAALPGVEVAWIAEDGQAAFAKCLTDRPDLILMDMIMPVMDGVEATRLIMQKCPCPIVVVTATVEGNAGRVYAALGHGALDAVNTPVFGTGGTATGAEALIRKIKTVQSLSQPRPSVESPVSLPAPETTPAILSPQLPLIAIGASTGGPQALSVLLSGLPRPLPWPVVVIQHVDPIFAPGLADWLSAETGQLVRIAVEGEMPSPGGVLIAASGDHLVLDPAGRVKYQREPADEPYRPSVDVFFRSLLRGAVRPSVAVLLTGMGRDGAAGLLQLRQAGWHTIAQDESSSVVWGMPGAAVQLGAAEQTLPIEAISIAVRTGMGLAGQAPS